MMTPIVPKKEVLKQRLFAAVNKVDPVGLIAIGAPDDEYTAEIQEIMKLSRNSERLITAKLVKKAFDKYFNLDCTMVKMEDAEKIVKELKRR